MWTQKRLLALYQRYNRRYWNGELPPYKIEIRRCRRCSGFTLHRSFMIAINVAGHVNDDEVRLTLLHEMVHVAALDSPAHSLDFWQEVDRLLGKGAPPELVRPVSRRLRTILRTHASSLEALLTSKRAVRKMEGDRERLRWWERETEVEVEYRENPDEVPSSSEGTYMDASIDLDRAGNRPC